MPLSELFLVPSALNEQLESDMAASSCCLHLHFRSRDAQQLLLGVSELAKLFEGAQRSWRLRI